MIIYRRCSERGRQLLVPHQIQMLSKMGGMWLFKGENKHIQLVTVNQRRDDCEWVPMTSHLRPLLLKFPQFELEGDRFVSKEMNNMRVPIEQQYQFITSIETPAQSYFQGLLRQRPESSGSPEKCVFLVARHSSSFNPQMHCRLTDPQEPCWVGSWSALNWIIPLNRYFFSYWQHWHEICFTRQFK